MARHTRAGNRLEMERLARGLDLRRASRLDRLRRAAPPGTEPDPVPVAVPGARFPDLFEAQRGTGAAALREVRPLYARIGSDVRRTRQDGNAEDAAWLDASQAEMGVPFWPPAGHGRRVAETAIARRRIATRGAWEALSERLSDLSQTTLPPDEAAAVARLV